MAKPKAKTKKPAAKSKAKSKPAKAAAKAKPAKAVAKAKPAKAIAKAKPPAKAIAKAKPPAKAIAKPAKAPAKAKSAPPKAPPPPTKLDQADLMHGDGMKVPSRGEREAAVASSGQSPHYAKVRATILGAFRSHFPTEPPETDAQILATDPNDFDVDPSNFYEMLGKKFGLGQDPDNDYFGGFGGTIETTIANVTKRWDGKLH